MDNKKLRIIKIVNESTIIGNKGSKDGIRADYTFRIIGKDGIKITDPETGEVLGEYSGDKGIVYPSEIYDKFTVFRSKFIDSVVKHANPFEAAIRANAGIPKDIKIPAHYEKLDIDLKDVSSLGNQEPVKIGDFLEKIN